MECSVYQQARFGGLNSRKQHRPDNVIVEVRHALVCKWHLKRPDVIFQIRTAQLLWKPRCQPAEYAAMNPLVGQWQSEKLGTDQTLWRPLWIQYWNVLRAFPGIAWCHHRAAETDSRIAGLALPVQQCLLNLNSTTAPPYRVNSSDAATREAKSGVVPSPAGHSWMSSIRKEVKTSKFSFIYLFCKILC